MPSKSRFTDSTFLALAAKKAKSFVLWQNWFADPLEVSIFNQNLDTNLQKLANDIENETFEITSCLPVIVPKKKIITRVPVATKHEVRPLTHLDFATQVFSCAILSVIANEWENKFGDPAVEAKKMILGNRLNRVSEGEEKNFAQGSKALYRYWAADYPKYISSTSSSFNENLAKIQPEKRILLFSTDLTNFYPSVDLDLMAKIISSSDSLSPEEKNQAILFFKKLKNSMHKINQDGLPQGMVASGFFANMYLHELDEAIVKDLATAEELKRLNAKVLFYARYVDDMQIILFMDAVKGKPIKKLNQHVLFKCIKQLLKKYKLEMSENKTTLLEENADGAQLSEGLLAEHMGDLANRVYGSLSPDAIKVSSKDLRLLFGIDSVAERLPSNGEIQRGKFQPVIDGPGVRSDSRRRFSAGRWRKLYYTYRDCVPELEKHKTAFIDEIYREWKNDPSQLRLLFFSMELNDFKDKTLKNTLSYLDSYVTKYKDAIGWLPFIYASILRTYIRLAARSKKRSTIIQKLAKEKMHDSNPWFLRVMAYECLAVYGQRFEIDPKEEFDNPHLNSAINLWRFVSRPFAGGPFRELFTLAKNSGVSNKLLINKILQYLKDTSLSSEAKQIVVENYLLLKEHKQPIKCKNSDICKFGKVLGLNFSYVSQHVTAGPISPVLKKNSLAIPIRKGEYRVERDACDLCLRIINYIRRKQNQKELCIAGLINPFTLKEADGKIVDSGENLSLSGWKSLDWSKVTWIKPGKISAEWCWPLGLILRAVLTGNPVHLTGAGPSSRYSLFLDYRSLNSQGAFCSEKMAKVVMRLLRWPGSDIAPFRRFDEIKKELIHIKKIARQNSHKGVQVLSVSPFAENQEKNITLAICQIDHGLDLKKINGKEPQLRRAVLYALEEVVNKLKISSDLGIQSKEKGHIFVILPELSVPELAIGDIHRFVLKNKVNVLYGRYHYKDKTNKLRNSLYWVFPSTHSWYGSSTFQLRQDKIFPAQYELTRLRVEPANPKIIWQIKLNDRRRLCGLNCYELTSPVIKGLISGKAEAVFICARNKDVDQFDSQAKSFSFDIHGFVSVVNTADKGGSCLFAPYRGREHEKRLLHLHGENQFNVSICQISLDDFRDPNNLRAKHPPAGFPELYDA